MPEVDGLDILRYVRSNTLLEDLPVISECGMLCCGVLWRGWGGVSSESWAWPWVGWPEVSWGCGVVWCPERACLSRLSCSDASVCVCMQLAQPHNACLLVLSCPVLPCSDVCQ